MDIMDNANKIFSFVLGLVVVIVFLAIITGRLNLKQIRILPLSKNTTLTPTISPSPTPELSAMQPVVNTNQKTSNTNTQTLGSVKTIPNTGVTTLLLPLAISGLFGGIYLRKKAR